MPQWLLLLAIVAAALICPAMMWLGRRGIGPGCAVCPPRRGESLEDLRAQQRALAAKIENLEGRAIDERVQKPVSVAELENNVELASNAPARPSSTH